LAFSVLYCPQLIRECPNKTPGPTYIHRAIIGESEKGEVEDRVACRNFRVLLAKQSCKKLLSSYL
jgi:hypothetical protein